MSELFLTVFIGIGATLLMDLWGIVRKPLCGVAPADYTLVGRWLGHMIEGRFCHASITTAVPFRGERILGWTAHYVIGIGFAALLVVIQGRVWLTSPTVLPALEVGIGAVVAPFFLMLPCMGAGVAGSKTPKPALFRWHSLLAHAVFGVGLYATAFVMTLITSI